MKAKLLLFLVFLFATPFVQANVIFPYYIMVNGANVFLLIPIVLVETVTAYYYAWSFQKIKLKFSKLSFAFLVANTISSIVGFLIAWGIYILINVIFVEAGTYEDTNYETVINQLFYPARGDTIRPFCGI
ncbi:hypothetical protein J4421_03785 [Candidatus Woesearchaeota archaeon]|nr:hypothetical protein [Candidatus Woesearchaeota archaeon]